MQLARLAAAAAGLCLAAGTAAAANFEDAVYQGQYKVYHFDFGADPNPIIGADTIGMYGNWIGGDDGYISTFAAFPSFICGGNPATCSGLDDLGISFRWVSFGSELSLYIANATTNYNTCAETHATLCYQNWTRPLSVRSYGPADDWVVSVTTGAVPEPATWAMMIVGFGLVGAAARRRVRALTA